MIGQTIAHYRITAKLGEGGMGEVYRATDTKLGRDVAIKIIPSAFAQDSDRMARFQREAEVLASLNHPNIAAIYGVEDRALIMELVDGEAPRGPMPFDEAWRIASQIAAALEYAHDKGIVHRDLKPANVKITPEGVVKLLDFGLAKAFTNPREAATNVENSPTLTIGATEVGVILGTAAYMSPEQAKGKTVDRRADVWAFGAVLYEMLSGKQPFHGEDVMEILAAVVNKEPAFDALPAKTPSVIRNLVRRCLEKNIKRRLQHIGEARILIDDALSGAAPAEAVSAAPGKNRERLPWAVAAALAVLLGVASWALWRATRPVEQALRPLVRLDVDLGANVSLGSLYG
ncbi:MAG: serine/threonine-protein kinase, partial [Terriglobales bacterium]